MDAVVFQSDAAKRIVAATRRVEAMKDDLGRRGGMLGIVAGDTIPIYNVSASPLPEGGVAWIVGIEADGVTYTVDLPDFSGVTDLAVATAAIAAGGYGRAWEFGLRKIAVTGHAALVIGDRISAGLGSFYAQADALGPMQIVAKLTSPYVLAEITGRRGDTLLVFERDYPLATANMLEAQVLVLAAGWTIGDLGSGHVDAQWT